MSPVVVYTFGLPAGSPWRSLANPHGLPAWTVSAAGVADTARTDAGEAVVIAGDAVPPTMRPLAEKVPVVSVAADGTARDAAGAALPAGDPSAVLAAHIDAWHAARKLAELGKYGREFLNEVLDLVLAEGPQQVAAARAAAEAGDWGAAAKVAHKFRSSAGNFGLRSAYLLAGGLEAAAAALRDGRGGDPAAAVALAAALEAAFARRRPALVAARAG